jgi:Uma2 family endonuclease
MSAMTAAIPPKTRATLEEFLKRVETDDRLELVDGEIVEQAGGGPEHSHAIARVSSSVDYPFGSRHPGSRGPGGWWIFSDLGVGYTNGDVYAHDLCGFRRDRFPNRPENFPVMSRPDWACEILSPTHEKRDLVIKPTTLHADGVPHYWVLDHQQKLLFVHRWSPDGYVVVLRASAGDTVRAEPFEAIEIQVSDLFGDD